MKCKFSWLILDLHNFGLRQRLIILIVVNKLFSFLQRIRQNATLTTYFYRVTLSKWNFDIVKITDVKLCMRLRTNSPAVLQMLMKTRLVMLIKLMLISRLLIIAAVHQWTTSLQNGELSPANCLQHHFIEVWRVSTEFTSPQLWSASLSVSLSSSSCGGGGGGGLVTIARHRRYYSEPVRKTVFFQSSFTVALKASVV